MKKNSKARNINEDSILFQFTFRPCHILLQFASHFLHDLLPPHLLAPVASFKSSIYLSHHIAFSLLMLKLDIHQTSITFDKHRYFDLS